MQYTRLRLTCTLIKSNGKVTMLIMTSIVLCFKIWLYALCLHMINRAVQEICIGFSICCPSTYQVPIHNVLNFGPSVFI